MAFDDSAAGNEGVADATVRGIHRSHLLAVQALIADCDDGAMVFGLRTGFFF